VLGEDGELALRAAWVHEAGRRPLEDAIAAHIAEQKESLVPSLNPQRPLAAFKDAFSLKELQLRVGCQNVVDAWIEPDNAARRDGLRIRRRAKEHDQPEQIQRIVRKFRHDVPSVWPDAIPAAGIRQKEIGNSRVSLSPA
jgi:hypothetical protein